MLFAKAVTGLWLVRVKIPQPLAWILTFLCSLSLLSFGKPRVSRHRSKEHVMQMHAKTGVKNAETPEVKSGGVLGNKAAPGSGANAPTPLPPTTSVVTKKIDKPRSLYPAAMLGTAMTARGEIGFLIASLAETTGLFASSDTTKRSTSSSEIYLVVTWAIVLCTIIGPLGLGTLVKRVRRLQSERENNPGKADPLGIWGVG